MPTMNHAAPGLANVLDPTVAAHIWAGYKRHSGSEAAADSALAAFLDALGRPPHATTLRNNPLVGSAESAAAQLTRALGAASNAVQIRVHPLVPSIVEITRCSVQDENSSQGDGAETPTVLVTSKCGESVLRGADVYRPGLLGAIHAPSCSEGPELLSVPQLELLMSEGAEQRCGCFISGKQVAVVAVVRGRSIGGVTVNDRRPVGVGLLHPQLTAAQTVARSCQEASGPISCPVHSAYWDTPRDAGRAIKTGVAVSMTNRVSNAAPPVPLATLPEQLQQRIFAQNLPCTVCGLVLDPQPHETVVDLCAG